jgi:hypothetical protein
MSFTHNRTYPVTAEFTKEQLLAIKPHHVKRWLNERAYHTPTPTEQDRPIYQRAGSLKKAKQALSFYHPNKHVPWLEGRGGNPTIHSTLNALIRRVDLLEVRDLGKKANDKRPYTREEFNKKLELFRAVRVLRARRVLFIKYFRHSSSVLVDYLITSVRIHRDR